MPPDKLKIVLSRTDSIGDVVLTLPMAGFIKKYRPLATVLFLGRTYTKDVAALSEHIDGFINYDELEKLDEAARVQKMKSHAVDVFIHVFPVRDIAVLAKRSGIPHRIGTTNRLYHWLNCNKLVRLSRRKSNLHEAQLNLKLLDFLNFSKIPSLAEIESYYGFTKLPVLNHEYEKWRDYTRKNVILHPRSKGSAREWGADNFAELARIMPGDKYKLFVSGTAEDGEHLRDFIERNPSVTDLTGKMSLAQFIAFISVSDALVAASTGPLHIAAALGKVAVGLYPAKRPMHPGRWRPIGTRAHSLVNDPACADCLSGGECNCVEKISPQRVMEVLEHELFQG